MISSKQEVERHVIMVLQQLAADWEYDETITPETSLFSDLGFQSLDIVVLANSMQEHYSKVIPYINLFSDLGLREIKDVTVGEWTEYTYHHLNDLTLEQAHDI